MCIYMPILYRVCVCARTCMHMCTRVYVCMHVDACGKQKRCKVKLHRSLGSVDLTSQKEILHRPLTACQRWDEKQEDTDLDMFWNYLLKCKNVVNSGSGLNDDSSVMSGLRRATAAFSLNTLINLNRSKAKTFTDLSDFLLRFRIPL